MSGILYVTGTPIGNLGDFSPRAAETLESVDFIAAEDTRVTLKLLNHFGIKKPMVSYFEHNKRERGEIICNRIEQGENCAIVTDAGMPCISDPGEDLIKLCEERGIKTVVIPGPSAVISALAVSGLGAKLVVSRAERDVQEKFLLRNGADEVIYPEKQVANWAAIRYTADHIRDYIEVDEGHAIFEVEVPKGWIGKTVGELDIRRKYSINIMATKENGKINMAVSPETVLTDKITLLVLGAYKELQKCFRI